MDRLIDQCSSRARAPINVFFFSFSEQGRGRERERERGRGGVGDRRGRAGALARRLPVRRLLASKPLRAPQFYYEVPTCTTLLGRCSVSTYMPEILIIDFCLWTEYL